MDYVVIEKVCKSLIFIKYYVKLEEVYGGLRHGREGLQLPNILEKNMFS